MTLLIADDCSEIRRILNHLLQDKFDTIFDVENGLEAIRVYEKHKPDWVLMDIEMPELDGFSAIKAIKEKFANAKIIAISKFDDPKMADYAESLGAVAFFNKEDLNKISIFIGSYNKYKSFF